MLRSTLLAALLTMLSATAMARETIPQCVSHQQQIDTLRDKYNEARVALGVTAVGSVMEVLASSDGTWTVIVTQPNGVSCIKGWGTGWEPRPETHELKTKGPPA